MLLQPKKRISLQLRVLKIAAVTSVICLLAYVYGQVAEQKRNGELIDSIKAGDKRRTVRLLDAGADPNTHELLTSNMTPWEQIVYLFWSRRDSTKSGPCCLLLVAERDRCDADVIQALLAHGATGVDAHNEKGEAVALLTALHGSCEASWELLQHGAMLHSERDREFLLGEAASVGDSRIITKLLELKTDIEARSCRDDANHPLIRAAEEGHIEIVKLLLQKGADVDWPDDVGNTALMSAVGNDRIDIVVLLLQHGADAKRTGRWGVPLESAIAQGDLKLVRILVEAGAETDYVGYHDSVEESLEASDNKEIIAYIREHNRKSRHAHSTAVRP